MSATEQDKGQNVRFIYCQDTGELRGAESLDVITIGYSGFPPHRNVGADDNLHGLGPIPKGIYRIGAPYDHPSLGPAAIPLEPVTGTDTHGRGGFFAHGESIRHPGLGSHGCIVIGRVPRDMVAQHVGELISVIDRFVDPTAETVDTDPKGG